MSAAAGGSASERRRILEQRARALAAPPPELEGEVLAVIAFRVGGDRYAAQVGQVSQVADIQGLHPLAGAPRWLLGAIQGRSSIVPVLDLRRLLGLEGGALVDSTRVVILEHEGEAFGLAVDSVEGHLDLPRKDLLPGTGGPFLWLSSDRLAVLDAARLEPDAGGPKG